MSDKKGVGNKTERIEEDLVNNRSILSTPFFTETIHSEMKKKKKNSRVDLMGDEE